jgi:Putative Flp pilus-assembly TadE/G-like
MRMLHARTLRQRQRGQSTLWLVSTILVVVLAFGLVADGAVLFAAHRRALGLADAAARAGAGQVDVARLRLEPESPARLDPASARSTALAFVARQEPEATSEAAVTDEQIVVRVHLRAPTAILHPFGHAVLDVVAEAEAAPFSGVEVPTR